MKKLILILLISFTVLIAHEDLTLELVDNKDNTITIIGDEEHHQGLAGALIKIESLISGELLFKDRLPRDSKMTIPIPKEPYQVVLDTTDEVLTKIGITPIEGFKQEHQLKADEVIAKLSKESHDEDEWDSLTILFFSLCLIMFIIAIYYSNKNTNRLLNKQKEN